MKCFRSISVIWGGWLFDWTASGNVVPQIAYYAYGLPVQDSYVSITTPYLYGGKEFYSLKGINLYDFHARTYAPDECRFWQPDPLATENHGVSPYIFCNGDPINFVDPTGQTLSAISNGITYTWKYTDSNGRGFYDINGEIYNGNDLSINRVS